MKVYNIHSKRPNVGFLLLLGLASLETQPLAAQAPDPSQAGLWGPVQNWPLEAIHLVVLQTGKVLAIGRMFPTCDYFLENAEGYIVFDPSNGTVSQVAGPPDPPGIQLAHVLFCAGHSALPDGRIMFNGGFLNPNVFKTSIFDPDNGPNGSWTTLSEDTDIGRFYPTLTTLADGRVLVMAGRSVQDTIEPIYTTPQIFDPAAPLGSQFSLLTDARHCRLAGCGSNPCELNCSTVSNPDNQFLVHFYPFMFQLTDGSVFYGGEDEWPLPSVPIRSKRFGVGGLGSWSDIVSADDPITGGSAVMYKPDKIIKAGGENAATFGLDSVYRFNAAAANPQWETIASFNHAREDFYLIALPDGSVLAVGGKAGIDATPVYVPELLNKPDDPWVPANPSPGTTWQEMAPLTERRGYHSAAVLLPDARVLIAGGEDRAAQPGQCPSTPCPRPPQCTPEVCPQPGDPDHALCRCRLPACPQKTAQIFSPPYLFAPGGSPAVRPVIRKVFGDAQLSDVIEYGESFRVQTYEAFNVSAVSLIRLGAATHSFDQDQRFVPLSFSACIDALTVAAPADGNVAPPGFYMLFVVADGVPSVASIVHLRSASPPPDCPPSATVAAVGSRYIAVTPGPHDCQRSIHMIHQWSEQIPAGCLAGHVQENHAIDSGAVLKTGSQWGTAYVRDADIRPGLTYQVRIRGLCGESLEGPFDVTPWLWADTNNDAIVEVSDVLCILAVYANPNYALGNCTFYSANIAPCEIDNQVELSDVLAVLAAYEGGGYPHPPCGCEPTGGGMQMEGFGEESAMGFGGGGFTFNTVWVSAAPPTTIPPEGAVTVRAFVFGPEDLRGYQVGLQITGGTAGALTVESLNVETSRTDFVYFEMDPVVAASLNDARLAAAPFDGSGYVGEDNRYLGRFVLRASHDAAGTFTVQVRAADTSLRNSDHEPLNYSIGSPVQITIADP